MTPREAIDYLFDTYKERFENDTKFFDAIVVIKKELERTKVGPELYLYLLSMLVHYSEEAAKAQSGNDKTCQLVMGSKQAAILDVLAQIR